MSFRRAPILQDKPVTSHPSRSKKTTWLHRQILGTYKCGFYNHCSHIRECKQFVDFKSSKMYNIQAFINCNTTFVVYRLSCAFGSLDIRQTKRRLEDRISGHKNAIKVAHFDYPMAKQVHTTAIQRDGQKEH